MEGSHKFGFMLITSIAFMLCRSDIFSVILHKLPRLALRFESGAKCEFIGMSQKILTCKKHSRLMKEYVIPNELISNLFINCLIK